MKKTVVAFTIAGTLVGLSGGYAIGFYNADQRQDEKIIGEINRLANIKERPRVELDQQTSMEYMGRERLVSSEGEESIISDTYEIITMESDEIVVESAREEDGDNITFDKKIFTSKGFHPDYGDIYRVGWKESDYNHQEWDKVVLVEQIK
ncbi:hypothetical protein BAOM_p037 (plasmid) [Peribacillus asahii]|uniref:Uncharacterized protein n=1 Tax=Peribacillus asahii TaxID=228899 RepID=A0A3Q9RRL6_9BACI|nr:hypothetical protein [Peribacillus asahii]AZV45690.1 hypothetical protein BAOM_p037 [Peribacillus asahii]